METPGISKTIFLTSASKQFKIETPGTLKSPPKIQKE
jgi:hypothetical protein